MLIPADNGKIQHHNDVQRQQDRRKTLYFIKLLPLVQK